MTMKQMMTKTLQFAKCNWPYGAVFVAGAGIGAVCGWIFCKKKLEKAYTDAVDKQVEDYKKKKEAEVGKIIGQIAPIPPEEEVVDAKTAAAVQTSDIANFKQTPQEKQTRYDNMYKGGDARRSRVAAKIDISSAAETTEEQIGRVDSKKLNDVPRDRSGRIKRGGTELTRAAYEDTPEEDQVHLYWYMEDDILADPDGDIWDEDDTFGDDLAKWKEDDELLSCVMNSNYYSDKVFLIEKKNCSYSDIFDTDLDDYLYGEE